MPLVFTELCLYITLTGWSFWDPRTCIAPLSCFIGFKTFLALLWLKMQKFFFMLVLLRRTSFWTLSKSCISIINYTLNFTSLCLFLEAAQVLLSPVLWSLNPRIYGLLTHYTHSFRSDTYERCILIQLSNQLKLQLPRPTRDGATSYY